MYSRNSTADLLKGIAVVLMIQVHVMEQFATLEVSRSMVGTVSLFLGGPPAAPVFLAVMGFFLAVSHKSMSQLIRRGILLIVGGIALNIALNANLLYSIHLGRFQLDPLAFVFGADILPLAGLSIVCVAVLRNVLQPGALGYTCAAFLVASISPVLTLRELHPSLTYVIPFFWGNQWWSYFPLFPWFSYALLGVAIGSSPAVLDDAISRNPRNHFVIVLVLASALIVTSHFVIDSIVDLSQYYHHGLVVFGWIAGFLAVWYTMASALDLRFGNSAVCRYLHWLGRNVTSAYVVQWLIIGNIATELYRTQSLLQSAVWFAVILSGTSLLVLLFRRMKRSLPTSPVSSS